MNQRKPTKAPPTALTATEREFHLEEYKTLRAEVAALLTRIELLIRYAALGSAAVLSWLLLNTLGLTDDSKECVKVAARYLLLVWWIPPTMVLACGVLSLISYIRVSQVGAYLAQLECALGSAALGWEKYLKPKLALLTFTTAAVWGGVMGTTVYASHVGLEKFSFSTPACKSPK